MDALLDLRPMSIGEILDRSFRLYRNHFLQFFVAALLVQAPVFIVTQFYWSQCLVPLLQILSTTASRLQPDPVILKTIAIGTILFFAVSAVLSLLALGALVHLATETFLGKVMSIGEAYRRAIQQFGPLLRVNMIKLNILGIAALIWLVPEAVAFFMKQWWVMSAWVIVGALPSLFAYLGLALVSIVLLLEKRGLVASLRRSWELMFVLTEKGFLRNNGFRISILLLVILAVKSFVHAGIQGPYVAWKGMEIFHDLSLLEHYHRTWIDSMVDLVVMIVQAATVPFGLATLVLFYFDIRIRKEGLDLSVRLQALRDQWKGSHEAKV